VLDMLGAVDPEEVFQLLACVLEHNVEGAFAFLNQFATKSDAYEHLCAALIQALHELAMSQARPAYVKECSPKRQSWIKQLAPKCKAHELQLLYQFALMGQKDIRQTPWPKQGFEMLLLRMLSFIPLPSIDAMTIKTAGLASTPAQNSAPALKGRVSTAAAAVAHVSQSASAPTSFNAQVAPSARVPSTANSQAPSTVSTHALSNPDSQALLTSSAHMPSMPTPHVPRLDRGIHTPQPEFLPPAPAENSPSSKVTALYNKLSHLTQENRAYVLRELVETLAFSGIARQVLLHSELLAFESGTIKLSLSKQYQASLSDHIKTHIEQTLKKAFSTSCSLEIHTAAGEVQSPIKKEALARQEQQTKAELAAAQNEHIQFLQQTFGAAIVPGSVKQVIS
jgi:DNA polymerase III subunit gamma/tau